MIRSVKRVAVALVAAAAGVVGLAAPASATWTDSAGPGLPPAGQYSNHVVCTQARGVNGTWGRWKCGQHTETGWDQSVDPMVYGQGGKVRGLRFKQWGLPLLCVDALVGGLGWRGAQCGGENQVFEVGSPDNSHYVNGLSIANYHPSDVISFEATRYDGYQVEHTLIGPESWYLFDLGGPLKGFWIL
ncbi:hypothetical protein [Actinokineospora bangkokensis]|uniref:Ricin B lectin domain-containing protein n=1 Tax=Actinokineospora bangkokensis TaxID=1193682 RepID=A0A1Q9LIK7_9PSEU|nr:hypothetical protein [Actinokineospora bangkokensis]OLR91809.1 hypothetical protein BJP25_23500 [Actinokineospora bangkokensis]